MRRLLVWPITAYMRLIEYVWLDRYTDVWTGAPSYLSRTAPSPRVRATAPPAVATPLSVFFYRLAVGFASGVTVGLLIYVSAS